MQGKFNFIKLEQVILRHFSLYKKNGHVCEVSEEINEGVYCLAGANGLGKTTFLNAVNYGLTGIVLEPGKEVYSPGEIVNGNKHYTKRYFVGRISKKDEDKAEIEILFKINDKHFKIVRGFTERDELRDLEIFSKNNGRQIKHFEKKAEAPKELNDRYEKELYSEIGFANFNYFVFYQLYIFTFDENRRMIFWDDRASSHAMAIAFNSNPDDAERMMDLSRRMEKHESNARNSKWQSTQAKKKLEELLKNTKRKGHSDIEKLEREYNKLHRELEKAEKTYNNIRIEYDAMLKRQTQLNSDIMQLKTFHTKLFSRYSKPRSSLLDNTNIRLSLKNHECCVCGTTGSLVSDYIERNIRKDKCPLCNTSINESENSQQTILLKQIEANDESISSKNSELEELITEMNGKKQEYDRSEIEFNKAKEKVDAFAEDNPDISAKESSSESIDSLIEQYKRQYELAAKEAKDEYARRDKLRPEYEKYLNSVEIAYKEAETIFVPTFKKLAKCFIGHELNIQLNTPPKGEKSRLRLGLVLELHNTARTESFQLSESQRFFLDIALRMSLAIYLSRSKNGATMIIDTPEGSLDIAYESRVGNMFAEYVVSYRQNLLLTANINASQLLVSLAEHCGTEKMRFRRMLDWTDLSDIQKEGEHLFEAVYESIETALRKKKITK